MPSPLNPRLHTPEEIALSAGAGVPRLHLPDADVFAQRALRLRQCAAGSPMRDYLLLMAVLCEAQATRLTTYPAVALPDAARADAASQAGQPLLAAAHWPRDPLWRGELRALLAQVLNKLPSDNPARASMQAVARWSDSALEQQADRLLAGITLGMDVAAAPLIAAGLQLHWTHLVRATADALGNPFGYAQDATRCPCCGSLPTASVTRAGGQRDGYRYLHCALCSAQWHMVRVKCTHCLGTSGIGYRALQALVDDSAPVARQPVQAETCDSCRHYLKIVHMEQDPEVEPVADDLASLTLDLLVAQEGYLRHGTNFMLLFGDAPQDESPAATASERGRA